MLGWGAYLSIEGELTGGMVIAASIIAGRALGAGRRRDRRLAPVHPFARRLQPHLAACSPTSPLNFERLNLPRPEGRLDVERLLFVPQGTKRVVLNGISFSLAPGDSLAIIGNSGAGKTTLGKMLVGSILPTSGNVRLDLMDLRNWDQRQFGENIGYLPQDVQLFPASIKANIARMRDDVDRRRNLSGGHAGRRARDDRHASRRATRPSWPPTVRRSRAARSSASRWPAPSSATRAWSCSTSPTPTSTAPATPRSPGRWCMPSSEKITVITITQRPSLLRSVDKILLLTNGTVSMFGQRQEVLQALAQRGLSTEMAAGSGLTGSHCHDRQPTRPPTASNGTRTCPRSIRKHTIIGLVLVFGCFGGLRSLGRRRRRWRPPSSPRAASWRPARTRSCSIWKAASSRKCWSTKATM